jgi:hypothetical protein
VAPPLLIGNAQKSATDSKGDIPMLKKIVLVGALAVASFLSLNLAAHTASAPSPSSPSAVTMKYPPCDPWVGGGCGR